jgi:hemerythrin-like domain-containing protein
MIATAILRNEHRLIQQVLDCVAAIADSANEKWDSQAAAQAVDFLRTFVDGCHRQKEETYVFPMLAAKGWSREGPTGQMLREHRQGREHLEAMSRAIEDDAAEAFNHAALDYVQLLRDHIAREDNILFPMVDCTLSTRDEQWLVEQFRRHEARTAPGTRDRCLELANELGRRLGVRSPG